MLTAIFCVLLFSLTAPFTRIATLELPALLVVSLRLSGAGLICAFLMYRERWIPPKRIWLLLTLTSLAGVTGFSLLTAFALREVPATHAAIGLAALPALTAGYATVRDRSNPGILFWLFAITGSALSIGYFFIQGAGRLHGGDLLLLLAVVSATLGYVEGGRLSREFGGSRIMSWAVLLALPLGLLLNLVLQENRLLSDLSLEGWIALVYLAFVSQALGMILWYHVLAAGPMEKVAMMQLMQPFFTLLAAYLFLNESVSLLSWLLAFAVVGCIVGATNTRKPIAEPAIDATIVKFIEETRAGNCSESAARTSERQD